MRSNTPSALSALGVALAIPLMALAALTAFTLCASDPRGGASDAASPPVAAERAPVSSSNAPRDLATNALAAPSPVVLASPPAARDVDPLRDVLASSDDAAKIAAIEGAVRDGRVGALPLLEATSLAREPEAAPAIIAATARLAAQGSDEDRASAARTLARWLRDESARDGRDAIGNVPNLIEALGAVGGPDATSALVSALDGPLDVSLGTLAVTSLASLGDPSAEDAVARFGARVAALAIGDDDGVGRELRDEAIAAANVATERLRR